MGATTIFSTTILPTTICSTTIFPTRLLLERLLLNRLLLEGLLLKRLLLHASLLLLLLHGKLLLLCHGNLLVRAALMQFRARFAFLDRFGGFRRDIDSANGFTIRIKGCTGIFTLISWSDTFNHQWYFASV